MAARLGVNLPFSFIFTCPFISRAQGLSCCRFATSSKKTFQKSGKDEPVAFSKSMAKFHTVDDTLGISKSKKSNFPLYLGLTLFTVIIYFGFLRKEPYSRPESLDELLQRIRISHEEKQKKQSEKMNETNKEELD